MSEQNPPPAQVSNPRLVSPLPERVQAPPTATLPVAITQEETYWLPDLISAHLLRVPVHSDWLLTSHSRVQTCSQLAVPPQFSGKVVPSAQVQVSAAFAWISPQPRFFN